MFVERIIVITLARHHNQNRLSRYPDQFPDRCLDIKDVFDDMSARHQIELIVIERQPRKKAAEKIDPITGNRQRGSIYANDFFKINRLR